MSRGSSWSPEDLIRRLQTAQDKPRHHLTMVDTMRISDKPWLCKKTERLSSLVQWKIAGGARIWGIARLHTSGKLDTTFAGGVGEDTITSSSPQVLEEVRGVAIQSDEKIVVVGHIENDSTTNGYLDFVVMRLNKVGQRHHL